MAWESSRFISRAVNVAREGDPILSSLGVVKVGRRGGESVGRGTSVSNRLPPKPQHSWSDEKTNGRTKSKSSRAYHVKEGEERV